VSPRWSDSAHAPARRSSIAASPAFEALEARSRPAPSHLLGAGMSGSSSPRRTWRFGSASTLVERAAQLAGREDADVCDRSRECSVTKVSTYSFAVRHCVSRALGEGVRMTCACPTVNERSTEPHPGREGRTPNTAGIGLDVPASSSNARATSPSTIGSRRGPDVWAIGECAGSRAVHQCRSTFPPSSEHLAGYIAPPRDRLVRSAVYRSPSRDRLGERTRNAGRRSPCAKVADDACSGRGTIADRRFMKALVGSTRRDRRVTMLGPSR